MKLRGSLIATASLAVVLASSAAMSQQPSKQDLDKARGIFRQGVALAYAHDCAGALVKYREVAQIKMTPQLAFAIGECEEQTGKLVSALGNYRMAQSSAAGDAKAEKDVAKAPERIAALEERIPKLTINRGKNADAATLSLDGSELGASQIGSPFMVDPGPHIVVAKQGGAIALSETMTLAEKESKVFDVTLKDTAPPPPPTDTAVVDTPPPAPTEEPKGKSKAPAAVLLGVGGVSIVMGAVFMGLRGGTLSDLETACGGTKTCPPSAKSIGDKGKLYTGLAEVTFGVGAIGVVTGIVLLATSGPAKPKPVELNTVRADPDGVRKRPLGPKVRLAVGAPSADVGGASVVGRF